jgi:hypothetical protein
MEKLILGLGGIIAALVVYIKFKGMLTDKIASKLENAEAKGKSDVIEAKREEIKKDLEAIDKETAKAKEDAGKQSSDFWKGKL